MTALDIALALSASRAFRSEFFAAPSEALSKRGMSIDNDTLGRVEQYTWTSPRALSNSFDSKDVLRCSVGY